MSMRQSLLVVGHSGLHNSIVGQYLVDDRLTALSAVDVKWSQEWGRSSTSLSILATE